MQGGEHFLDFTLELRYTSSILIAALGREVGCLANHIIDCVLRNTLLGELVGVIVDKVHNRLIQAGRYHITTIRLVSALKRLIKGVPRGLIHASIGAVTHGTLDVTLEV